MVCDVLFFFSFLILTVFFVQVKETKYIRLQIHLQNLCISIQLILQIIIIIVYKCFTCENDFFFSVFLMY